MMMRGSEEWEVRKAKEKKKRLWRGYCAIIPNTTKTRTNCLHMLGIFYLDDIPQSKYTLFPK